MCTFAYKLYRPCFFNKVLCLLWPRIMWALPSRDYFQVLYHPEGVQSHTRKWCKLKAQMLWGPIHAWFHPSADILIISLTLGRVLKILLYYWACHSFRALTWYQCLTSRASCSGPSLLSLCASQVFNYPFTIVYRDFP